MSHHSCGYLRFVVGAASQKPRFLWGLLQDPRTDRVRARLEDYELELWDECLDWFNEHMNVPPFRADSLSRRGVCWLRDDAHDAIRQLRVLEYLRGEVGLPTRTLVSRQPGRILYRDELQVVAVPWRRVSR